MKQGMRESTMKSLIVIGSRKYRLYTAVVYKFLQRKSTNMVGRSPFRSMSRIIRKW